MNESVAAAKEADAKKGISPTHRSDESVHRVRDEPDRQLGSLGAVIGNIRSNGGTPSVDSIATQLSGMHTGARAPVLSALQQTQGNQYVQRVVTGIQAKLVVGQPGDKYEQEADRVADEVMRTAEPGVQRQAEEEEDEELIQTRPIAGQITPLTQRQEENEEEEEEPIQPKPVSGLSPEVTPDVRAQINAMKGGGHPLPESTRAFFESRFGYDFSQVLIHTDSRAAKATHALNARAFTLKKDIVFGTAQYAPATNAGQRLLGHELTHVVQQSPRPASSKSSLIGAKAPTPFLARTPVPRSRTERYIREMKEKPVEELIATYITPRFPFTTRQRRRIRTELRNRFHKKTDKDLLYFRDRAISGSESRSSQGAKELFAMIDHVLGQRQFSQKLAGGGGPFALVFYESDDAKSNFFRSQANSIARAIKAVKMPVSCPRDRSRLALETGSMGFEDTNILSGLKNAVRCVGRKADLIHIVGHAFNGVPYGRTTAQALSRYVTPEVELVFHGCSVLTYRSYLKILLGKLGPRAEIYAHEPVREAGRPYEFYKVTLPADENEIKTKLLKNVTAILPKSYIKEWARKQKTQRLRNLVKLSERSEKIVQKDAAAVFIEVLNERLRRRGSR